MTNRDVKIVLCGFSIIFFFSLFYNIKKFAIDKTSNTDIIEATVAILTLITTIITIYFVYKTYKAQREEINKQDEEIERNRRDTEFNRVLDLVYRQLDKSEGYFKKNNEASEARITRIVDEFFIHHKSFSEKANVEYQLDKKIILDDLNRLITHLVNYQSSLYNILKFYQRIIFSPVLKKKEINILSVILKESFLLERFNKFNTFYQKIFPLVGYYKDKFGENDNDRFVRIDSLFEFKQIFQFLILNTIEGVDEENVNFNEWRIRIEKYFSN